MHPQGGLVGVTVLTLSTHGVRSRVDDHQDDAELLDLGRQLLDVVRQRFDRPPVDEVVGLELEAVAGGDREAPADDGLGAGLPVEVEDRAVGRRRHPGDDLAPGGDRQGTGQGEQALARATRSEDHRRLFLQDDRFDQPGVGERLRSLGADVDEHFTLLLAEHDVLARRLRDRRTSPSADRVSASRASVQGRSGCARRCVEPGWEESVRLGLGAGEVGLDGSSPVSSSRDRLMR